MHAKGYEHVAELISHCKFLLVACGAGFSADSGLPVYSDVANINSYKQLGLTYHDLARPSIMLNGENEDDAQLFFGFWGHCSNMYRETEPHEGYRIIKKWADEISERFNHLQSNFKQFQVTFLRENFSREVDINDVAGPIFVYTSNVDAHFHQFFDSKQIYEIHGNVEKWQCQSPFECTEQLIEIPKEYRFDINHETMLLNSPSSYTQCDRCGKYRRPNVMMFGDQEWVSNTEQEERYVAWEAAVEYFISDQNDLIIMELGCGVTVPSVRMECEQVWNDTKNFSVLLRINIDQNDCTDDVINIHETSLYAVQTIDRKVNQQSLDLCKKK